MEMPNVIYVYIFHCFAHFKLATNDLKIINTYYYIPIIYIYIYTLDKWLFVV